jgi:hypothetical protein
MRDKDAEKRHQQRRRQNRSFPAVSFEDALVIPDAIQRFGGGHPKIRRITLFEQLGRSPESGPSRQQVTNSSRYKLTLGGYQAEFIELTPEGLAATNPEASPRDQLRARFGLAIEQIAPFKALYETFKNHKLPAQQVMRDHLVDSGMPEDEAQECVELFIVNAKFLGLLRPVAGTERILSLEHLLDEVPVTTADFRTPTLTAEPKPAGATAPNDWESVCFYITPIGDSDSDDRKHADVFLGHVVEPAIEALQMGLHVVRADQIENPGMITAQVIEHILNARLVVADLSFHNPNVFYELALRHATGKPTIHISRQFDVTPFDVADVRTIRIDTTDIHAFVTQMEAWRAELTSQARLALDDPDAALNPVTALGGAIVGTQRNES